MSSSAGGDMMKWASLILLVLQTTAQVLTMRYSRIAPMEKDAPRYLSSTAVVCSEAVKVITCLVIVYVQSSYSLRRAQAQISEQILRNPVDTLKICVPGVLYTVQNNLLFVALSNLDAGTYQVTYQLKILTTALFCVLMLGKSLRASQWVSLVLLAFGVALVQMAESGDSGSGKKDEKGEQSQFLGLFAVLSACVSSGFAGVYLEKMLKHSAPSIWMRNIQLGVYGVLSGLIGVALQDWSTVRENGFFGGYTTLVWGVVLLQAIGGLVIAAVIKYADNILKGFANAVSIILSASVSYALLADTNLTTQFFAGSALVVSATVMYAYEPKGPGFVPKPPLLRDRSSDRGDLTITRV